MPKYISITAWSTLESHLDEDCPNEFKFHLKAVIIKLKTFFNNKEPCDADNIAWTESFLLTVEACLDKTWEMLNSGYWKDVPINYRYCYSICSILKATLLEISSTLESNKQTIEETFKAMIQQIDKGILLGAPLPSHPSLLTEIASSLNKYFSQTMQVEGAPSGTIEIKEQDLHTDIFPNFLSVPCYTKPSMETFYCEIFNQKRAALLKDCIGHWKALHLWQDINYLKKVAGNRTVPIEIGSRYTEDDWTQSLVLFTDFLKSHILQKNENVGYLAQHQLFDQVPELKDDFSIPEYCTFTESDGRELPDINAWFGPNGTVSPLHFDPKNNLLCQVFGYKRIILYNPEETENLYPFESNMLCNTAQVDPYSPDYAKYPNHKKAQGYMCYLKPGDMLFIPPKWWHHVVGLTSSFSISFWWE